MTTTLSVLDTLLPLLYLVVFLLYVRLFRHVQSSAHRWATPVAVVVVLVHLADEILRGFHFARLPMGSKLEFASALAWALLATYLVLERRRGVKNTGWLPTGVAFLLQFTASAFATVAPEADPLLEDPGFAGHAVLALLAYTALTLSFVYALLYLVLARQLGRKRFGLFFRRLPSLDVLERMSVGAVELGAPLLLASLVLGHLWMYSLMDRLPAELAAQLSPWDPKVLASWVILLAYGVGLAGHHFLGWRGRRMSVLAVTAFVVVVLTIGFVRHFVPTFHDFRLHSGATGLAGPGPQARPVIGTRGGGA